MAKYLRIKTAHQPPARFLRPASEWPQRVTLSRLSYSLITANAGQVKRYQSSPSLSLSHTQTRTHTLSLSLSLSLYHAHAHSLSLILWRWNKILFCWFTFCFRWPQKKEIGRRRTNGAATFFLPTYFRRYSQPPSAQHLKEPYNRPP